MRLARGVLEGVDTVAPASDKGVPTDAKMSRCQEDHKKDKKWEVKIALQSSIWVILTTPLVACSATLVFRDDPSIFSVDTIFLHSTLSRTLFLIHFFYLQEHSSFWVQEDRVGRQDREVVHANQCCWAHHQRSGQDDPDWRLQGNSHLSFLFLPMIFLK